MSMYKMSLILQNTPHYFHKTPIYPIAYHPIAASNLPHPQPNFLKTLQKSRPKLAPRWKSRVKWAPSRSQPMRSRLRRPWPILMKLLNRPKLSRCWIRVKRGMSETTQSRVRRTRTTLTCPSDPHGDIPPSGRPWDSRLIRLKSWISCPAWTRWCSAWQQPTRAPRAASATCSAGGTTTRWSSRTSTAPSPSELHPCRSD